MGILKKFFPKKYNFYESLAEISDNISDASDLLKSLLTEWENIADYASKIHLLEHKCDDLTHRVISDLNETFITPIDREDIHSFVNSLDNIIDCMDVIASRINLYKVKYPIEFSLQLSEILDLQIKIIKDVLHKFEDDKEIQRKLVTIRDYETQGDNVFREAIASLFEKEKDVIELIKKKEILELMEKAIDRCQTVTIVIEGILIKNA
jgi:uncharacterized protein